MPAVLAVYFDRLYTRFSGVKVVLAIIIILILSSIGFFVIFFTKSPSAAYGAGPLDGSQGVPKSGTPIDLSAFDEICDDQIDGEVTFEPMSEEDKVMIESLLSQDMALSPEILKRNPPIRIAYTDSKSEKTLRDILPFRIIGSIEPNEAEGTKEYDFYIEAYCLLRNQERSFHSNGISGAWFNGYEINLGDHLAELFRKSVK